MWFGQRGQESVGDADLRKELLGTAKGPIWAPPEACVACCKPFFPKSAVKGKALRSPARWLAPVVSIRYLRRHSRRNQGVAATESWVDGTQHLRHYAILL